jgi:hypothetical protein
MSDTPQEAPKKPAPEVQVFTGPNALRRHELFRVYEVHDGVVRLGDSTYIMIRQTHAASRNPVNPGTDTSIELVVWGAYGPFAHYWPACGGAHWWDWLHDTDQDYFLKKVTNYRHTEFDPEESIRGARRDVLRMRREQDLDMAEAREAWEALDVEPDTENEFFNALVASKVFEDYMEMGDMVRHRLRPSMQRFWTHVWRPFIEQAKANQGFAADLERKPGVNHGHV